MTFKVATLSLSSSALKIKRGDISQWFVDGFSDAIVIVLHLFLYHISGFFFPSLKNFMCEKFIEATLEYVCSRKFWPLMYLCESYIQFPVMGSF